jgi:hypothetical protein
MNWVPPSIHNHWRSATSSIELPKRTVAWGGGQSIHGSSQAGRNQTSSRTRPAGLRSSKEKKKTTCFRLKPRNGRRRFFWAVVYQSAGRVRAGKWRRRRGTQRRKCVVVWNWVGSIGKRVRIWTPQPCSETTATTKRRRAGRFRLPMSSNAQGRLSTKGY